MVVLLPSTATVWNVHPCGRSPTVVACAAADTPPFEAANTPTFDVETLAGISAPLGFWDPMGLSAVPEGRMRFYREVELKHGRVAMLAAVGFPVAEQFHPLFGGGVDVPSYIAFQSTPLQAFWPLVLTAIAAFETRSIYTFDAPVEVRGVWSLMTSDYEGQQLQVDQSPFTIKPERVPGDLGFDPLRLRPSSEAELLEMQTKELNNGRSAMLGIVGMVVQELVTGSKLF
mmetsp:Transcript_23999/g.63361  ORF Transcript_23999/g.63361 Transcript_23999/m.63361 type:complete len:229 (+) Transcript_23999:25-711(+)